MKTWQDIESEESETIPPSFTCLDCKGKFKRGSQGNNEKYCLRCEHISLLTTNDYDFDELDY